MATTSLPPSSGKEMPLDPPCPHRVDALVTTANTAVPERRRSPAQRLRALASPFVFARGFAGNWRQVGSVVPSSPWLVDALLEPIDWAGARVVVELGPGTGVVTRAILKRLHPDAILLAVEANAEFADYLRQTTRDRRLRLVTGDAAALADHLRAAGLGSCDAVVSSLPLLSMTAGDRRRSLAAAAAALGDAGIFVAYQYTRRLHAGIARCFAQVRTERIWRNVPPAFLFVGLQPRRRGAAV